jgi:hypothetical protein
MRTAVEMGAWGFYLPRLKTNMVNVWRNWGMGNSCVCGVYMVEGVLEGWAGLNGGRVWQNKARARVHVHLSRRAELKWLHGLVGIGDMCARARTFRK